MKFYRGVVLNHFEMQSAQKKTPGIEFKISVREIKQGDEWIGVQWMEVNVWIYFSKMGNPEMSLRKLAFAGLRPGVGLRQMDLTGNTVQLTSKREEYNGNFREKFDLALPPRQPTEKSEDAFLAIDAILQAHPVSEVDLPEPIDPHAKQAPDAIDSSRAAPEGQDEEAPGFDFNDDDGDVPF